MTVDSRFGITLAVREGVTIVRVLGEVDIATSPALHKTLTRVRKSKPALVVVDLSWVTLFDASGIGVLSEMRRRLNTHAGEVRVVITESVVRSVFEATGFDHLVGVFDATADALPSAEQSETALAG